MAQSTTPSRHPRRTSGPTRRLYRRIQPPPPPQRPTPARHPATAYTTRPKASPANRADSHNRVRRDRVDTTGAISLRLAGRLHHIGVGRTHAGTRVLMLISDLNVRIINAATGELIRELTINPTRDYQPRGVKPGPKKPEP